MHKFQPGKTYQTRSICDYDTIFAVTIIKRTAKTVTTDRGLFRTFIWDDAECMRPWGNYSMAPIVDARKAT